MNQPGISTKPRILLAPLDWGLGHATRCIPIIHALLELGCSVILAGEAGIKTLLQEEFPELPFVHLKGYAVSYSKNKWTLPFVLATQIPKILSVIQYENQRVKELVKEHAIDAVISDNRFGFYHPGIPSVYITHQLLIKTSLGSAADSYLQKIHYQYVNRFTECWVPDSQQPENLAGLLSDPPVKPSIPVHYIGPLSRFSKPMNPLPPKHILLLLSGPEPQRTIFEKILIRELENYESPVVLIRGLPGNPEQLKVSPYVRIHNHLTATELENLMNEARIVISRCGYSTVMDLARMHKKSILIPTPGQTEQEYLSAHLTKLRFALCISQEKFRLKQALDLADTFPYHSAPSNGDSQLMNALKAFVNKIPF